MGGGEAQLAGCEPAFGSQREDLHANNKTPRVIHPPPHTGHTAGLCVRGAGPRLKESVVTAVQF